MPQLLSDGWQSMQCTGPVMGCAHDNKTVLMVGGADNAVSAAVESHGNHSLFT